MSTAPTARAQRGFKAPAGLASTAVPEAREAACIEPACIEPACIEPGSVAFGRARLALFLAGFSTFSLLYAVQPLLPSFTDEFGVGASQASLALSLATGFLAFSILCAGAVSEAVGRRGLMFASMAGGALLHLGSALAPSWHAILVLRALEGFVLGGVPAVAMAYLAEEIHPRALGATMGLYVGGTAFGGMMGRLGMGALTEFTTWRTAMGVLGLLDLAAALGFLLLLPPSRNFARRRGVNAAYHIGAWAGHLRNRGLPLLFLTGFLGLGVFVGTFNYLTFRLSAAPFSLSQGQISLVFAVFLCGVFASSAAGALADRLGRGPVLTAGVLIMGAGVALTLLPALPGIIAGVVGVTVGFFVVHAVASGWVGRMARGAKGHAASLYLLAYYLGSSCLGSAGGLFWTHGGWPAVVAFNAALLGLALAVAGLLWRGERRAA
ncbi:MULTISPECIES: MFS transporter [Methylobacterium]|uniref:MFS transporter n=1 Tax=Methylobacterium TaxID=407 RepID=UPI00082EB5EC|nr:MFS transporter [Methylobacterium sp. CCH5-D2]